MDIPPISLTMIPNSRIGVMFSGGLDSSILLFLLNKKNIEEGLNCEIIPLTVRNPKTLNEPFVEGVVDWQSKFFGRELTKPIYLGNFHQHHTKVVVTALFEGLKEHHLLMTYVADTQNPPVDVGAGWVAFRSPITREFRIQRPFATFDKRVPVALYYKHNVQEMLIHTHSCSELHGRCNTCFFCKEREWAFKDLNLVDLGTT